MLFNIFNMEKYSYVYYLVVSSILFVLGISCLIYDDKIIQHIILIGSILTFLGLLSFILSIYSFKKNPFNLKTRTIILVISLVFFSIAICFKLISAIKVGFFQIESLWDIIGVIIYSLLVIYILIEIKKTKTK